ncbi:MAG: HAD-IIIA family hydrolase [Bacteroidia bacterium]|nr:HAD-IIIA family hydrolase [Bacteroidia bacterium]
MNKGLLLDRDGVINEESGYIWEKGLFRFREGILDLIRAGVSLGYKIVVITNQGGIAKGLYTHEHVAALHAYMCNHIGQSGGRIDHIFYCPHHPDVEKCLCRKPQTLFFERAVAQYDLQKTNTWMLGDKARDLMPAQWIGLKTALVAEDDFHADLVLNHPGELIPYLN